MFSFGENLITWLISNIVMEIKLMMLYIFFLKKFKHIEELSFNKTFNKRVLLLF